MAANNRFAFRQRNPDLSVKIFRLFLCLNLSLMLLGTMIPSIEVEAATITVNTTDDELNSDGDCSLREAIDAANLNMAVDTCTAGTLGMDTITLLGATYVLSIPGPDEAGNTTGDLNITEDLTINGVSMTRPSSKAIRAGTTALWPSIMM